MPHTVLLRAYTTYQTELAAGGDGRPDYVERKTCNWITETFQVFFWSNLEAAAMLKDLLWK